jgi:hypothetical protein
MLHNGHLTLRAATNAAKVVRTTPVSIVIWPGPPWAEKTIVTDLGRSKMLPGQRSRWSGCSAPAGMAASREEK